MTTTNLTTTPPAARRQDSYAVAVRRARALLQFLLVTTLVAGIATTIVSFVAVNSTLASYREIVADSAVSAGAAQSARAALLAHHSAAADFLSLQDDPSGAATDSLQDANAKWDSYQESLRRLWQNRSDRLFGEFAVFEAADSAGWRYRGKIDAMVAFTGGSDPEAAEEAFLESHDILVREVVPALNGLESVKLESMEEAYATTAAQISAWQNALLIIGGGAVGLLLLALALTRFWLHYAWTWELAVAGLLALILFGWFNLTLVYAAQEVEVLVRDAYDTIAGVQSVEALLTQAEAAESMAIFQPEESAQFLSDADQYLFLMEQQLCGELACTDRPFTENGRISVDAQEAANDGQSKYGLPRTPLVANAYTNQFTGEAETLEALRGAIARYREANAQLDTELAAGEPTPTQRLASSAAYQDAITAAAQEQRIVRATFNEIYAQVTSAMELNRWLAILFTALALLGFWGIRRRRDALFA